MLQHCRSLREFTAHSVKGSCGLHIAQVLGSTGQEEDNITRRNLLQEAKANASMPDFFPDRRQTNAHNAVSIIPRSHLYME